MIKKSLSGLAFICALSFASTAMSTGFHAWHEDVSGNGLADIILEQRPDLLVTTSQGLIFRPRNAPVVICNYGDGLFEPCDILTGPPQASWDRVRAYFDAETQTIFVRAKESGDDSFVVAHNDQGEPYVIATISNSLIDGIDITDSAILIGFRDINGNGVGDLSIHRPGHAGLHAYTLENGDGTFSVSGAFRADIPNGFALRGQLRPASIPEAVAYNATANRFGQLDVNIPIKLPEGVASSIPGLSLSYSSASGIEAPLGRGWKLAGIPTLYRCSRSVDIDGDYGGYRFNDTANHYNGGDALCGQHGRLISTQGTSQHGPSGAYRYHGSSGNWVVFDGATTREITDDGGYYQYSPLIQGDSGTGSHTLIWAPDTYVNHYGNIVSYTYLESGGLLLPETITYDDVEVAFTYEVMPAMRAELGSTRSSAPSHPKVRIATHNNKLITGIEIRVAGESRRKYTLGYTFTDQPLSPRLTEVQECSIGSNGSHDCLIPVSFQHTDDQNYLTMSAIERFVNVPAFNDAGLNETIELDFNGDGKLDILTITNNRTAHTGIVKVATNSSNYAEQIMFPVSEVATKHAVIPFDFNGNGKQGIVFLRRGPNKVIPPAQIGEISVDYPDIVTLTYQQQQGYTRCGWAQHFNGTQLVTVYRCWKPRYGSSQTLAQLWWYRSDPEGGTNRIGTADRPAFCMDESHYSNFIQNAEYVRGFAADWNGDGRQDLILPSGNGCGPNQYIPRWRWYRNSGADISMTASIAGSFESMQFSQPVSLNGDGRTDLLFIHIASETWHTLLSGGDTSTAQYTSNGSSHNIPVKRTIPVDLNGDGRTDFLSAQPDENGDQAWFLYRNTGSGFLPPYRISAAGEVDEGLDRKRKEDLNVRVFNYNGSPYPDILLATKGQNYIVYETVIGSDGNPYFNTIDTGIEVKVDPENIRIADFTSNAINDIAELHSNYIRLISIDRPLYGKISSIRELWPGMPSDRSETLIEWDLTSESGTPSEQGWTKPLYTHMEFDNSESTSLSIVLPVIAEMLRPNGLGGRSRESYRYTGAIFGKHARGFQGFREVSTWNTDLAVKQVSIYAREEHLERPYFTLREERLYRADGGSIADPGALSLARKTEYGVLSRNIAICGQPHSWLSGEPPASCHNANAGTPFSPDTMVTRTSFFDHQGQEIKTIRRQSIRDSRGRNIGHRLETGVGASDSAPCSDPASCLALEQVHHTAEHHVTPQYLDTAITGPFLSTPSEVLQKASWAPGYAPLLSALPGSMDASDLTGPIEHVTQYQWLANTSLSGWRITPSSIVENHGTALARETAHLYAGSGATLRPAGTIISNHSGTSPSYSANAPMMTKVESWDAYGFPLQISQGTDVKLSLNIQRDRLFGGLISQIDDNGIGELTVFNGAGMPLQHTDANGSVITFEYDFCRNACPSLALHSVAWISRLQPGVGHDTIYLDLFGREVARKSFGFDGEAIWSTRRYDEKGRVIAESLPFSNCSYPGCAPEMTWDYRDHQGIVEAFRPDGGIIRTQSFARPGGGRLVQRSETIVGDALTTSGAPTTTTTLIGWDTLEDVMGNVISRIENADESSITMEYAHSPAGQTVWSQVDGQAETVVVRQHDQDGNPTRIIDPSSGTMAYRWDILGNLLEETHTGLDGTSERRFSYEYDELGRVVRRVHNDTEHEVTYHYETDSDGTHCGHGFLCQQRRTDGSASYRYSYNLLGGTWGAGQRSGKTVAIQAPGTSTRNFSFSYDHTHFGAIAGITYPDGTHIEYEYQNGLPRQVRNGATQDIYWQAEHYNAFGVPDQISLGNGIRRESEYDPATGHLLSQTAFLPGNAANRIQANRYGHDSRGRMTWRMLEDDQPDASMPSKTLRHQRERFLNDAWDRVTLAEVFRQSEGGPLTSESSETYAYDNLGNIRTFAGQSGYSYAEHTYSGGECAGHLAEPGPHAVRRIGTDTYCYNAFGELSSAGSRSYQWGGDHTAPIGITDTNGSATFLYGPSGERLYQQVSTGVVSMQRWSAGHGYEEELRDNIAIRRIYIGDFMVIETENEVASTRYLLRDHLGSVDVVMSDNATASSNVYDAVIAFQSHSLFGARRDGDWTSPWSGQTPLDEGYTGHMHLDSFDLIHMNGRVYDPTMGRFLSPDIIIQAPNFSQSYNRYSYVMNSPTSMTDPSGYQSFHYQQDGFLVIEITRGIESMLQFDGATIQVPFAIDQYQLDRQIEIAQWAQSATYNASITPPVPIMHSGGANHSGSTPAPYQGWSSDSTFDGTILHGRPSNSHMGIAFNPDQIAFQASQFSSITGIALNTQSVGLMGYYNMEHRSAQVVERATGRSTDLSRMSHIPDGAKSATRLAGRLGHLSYVADGYQAQAAYRRGDHLTASHHATSIAYGMGVTVTAATSTFGAPIILTGMGSYMLGDFISSRTTFPADMLCMATKKC